MDAGSSGSRVFVYSWGCGGAVTTVPGSELKIEPGLSSYAGKPAEAMASLAPLLRHAEQQIPAASQPQARLMILATAGLRMIPTLQSDEILTTLREGLGDRCEFQIKSSDVRILSGVDEGESQSKCADLPAVLLATVAAAAMVAAVTVAVAAAAAAAVAAAATPTASAAAAAPPSSNTCLANTRLHVTSARAAPRLIPPKAPSDGLPSTCCSDG